METTAITRMAMMMRMMSKVIIFHLLFLR